MMKIIKVLSCLLCLWAATLSVASAAGKDAFKDEPLIKARKWSEAQEFYAGKLIEFAESSGGRPVKDLVRLVLCYDISRYFGEMSGEDVAVLTDWLLSEPDFTTVLLGAFGPEDSPSRAFHVLAQLRSRFGAQKVLGFSGLAIAHAVVWDGKKPVSERFNAGDSFQFYVSNARKMTFNLSQVPYQAAVFLACAEAAPDERLWALGTYKSPRDMSAVYHSPEYDMDCLFGKPKKIADHDYTLPNLLKYGGICGDRAYFAANVARSCGIPAAWICGRGERGGHAWTGYIRPGKRGSYLWDLDCGRYEYDRYYTGATRDPQTGKEINDYELAMRTLGCGLSPDKLTAANAYVCLAGVLEKAEKFPLVKWALEQAIKNDRFDLTAWDSVTRLCQAGTFDADYAEQIMADALKKFPDEPDFCYGVFETMMATIPKDQFSRRKRLYQQAASFFNVRPDLTVAIGRDYGDYLLEMDKKRDAYEVYYDTIRAHMSDPRLVADMAVKVTEKRLEGDEPKKAVALLAALIKCSKRPPYSDAFAKDSAWYRLSDCLKGVYSKMGDEKAAASVEAELSKFERR